MEVGTDTYISLADADAYVTSRFVGADPDRVRWEALANGDKEIYLLNACRAIDTLPLQGEALRAGQTLAFPRARPALPEVPETVKLAQAELALWLSDSASRADGNLKLGLQAQGVSGISLGSTSMSFGLSGGEKSTAFVCPRAAELLKRYVYGGY